MRYEVRVEGAVDRQWSPLFDEAQIPDGDGPFTGFICELPDQAALHGVLARVRDAGLVLISAVRVDHEEEHTP